MTTMNWLIASQEHTGRHPRLGAGQTVPAALVQKYGKTDITQDPAYNEANNFVLVREMNPPSPDINLQDWYWNASTEELQQTPPA